MWNMLQVSTVPTKNDWNETNKAECVIVMMFQHQHHHHSIHVNILSCGSHRLHSYRLRIVIKIKRTAHWPFLIVFFFVLHCKGHTTLAIQKWKLAAIRCVRLEFCWALGVLSVVSFLPLHLHFAKMHGKFSAVRCLLLLYSWVRLCWVLFTPAAFKCVVK